MAFTHTIIRTYRDAQGYTFTATDTALADGEKSYDGTIATATTDQAVTITCVRAKLQALAILSDKVVKIETNAVDATGGSTIDLVANVPKIWSLALDGLTNCPFGEDVTVMYITNTSGATATIKIRILEDVTT